MAGLLDAARADLADGRAIGVERLLTITEMTTMVERHYADDQLAALARRRRQLREQRIGEVEAAWPRLIDEVLAAKDRGLPASDPEVRRLAARWQELLSAFTGDDPGIQASLGSVWEHEGERLTEEHGLNPRLADAAAYIGEVLQTE